MADGTIVPTSHQHRQNNAQSTKYDTHICESYKRKSKLVHGCYQFPYLGQPNTAMMVLLIWKICFADIKAV